MRPSQSSQSPESPSKICFCGCLASPYRDNKYCSEQCAREDTEKMLMGEPSHYRSVSQTEVLGRLVRSNSRCKVAERILVEANMAYNTGYERPNEFKPLPPLPPPPQLPTPRVFMDVKNTLAFHGQGGVRLPRSSVKRLRPSILASRKERSVV